MKRDMRETIKKKKNRTSPSPPPASLHLLWNYHPDSYSDILAAFPASAAFPKGMAENAFQHRNA